MTSLQGSATLGLNRERKYRDLVLAMEFTGDFCCFDACVKHTNIFGC